MMVPPTNQRLSRAIEGGFGYPALQQVEQKGHERGDDGGARRKVRRFVKVEQVPWAAGKHTLTRAYILHLAHWARKLSFACVPE